MQFKDKVIMVTGASSGIGAAWARAFAAQGALVVVNYRQNEAAAQQTVEQCRAAGGDAWAQQADVLNEQAVNDMVGRILDETGRIDVVVNNALRGYTFNPDTRASFAALDWQAYGEQVTHALKAACLVTRALLPHMQQHARGSVINMASDLAEKPVVPYHDYATAKAALIGFSRSLAADLGPYGIRVNCVAPGLVWPTDASRATRASIREEIAQATPLRR